MSLSWRCWWPHVWPGGVGPLRLPGQHHHNTPGPPTAQAATVVCPVPVFQWETKQTLFLKQVNGNHKNLSGFPCSLALKVFYPIRISTCTTSGLALKATLKNPSALPLREAFIKNYGIFHNRSDPPFGQNLWPRKGVQYWNILYFNYGNWHHWPPLPFP